MPSDTCRHSRRTIQDHRGSIYGTDSKASSIEALIMLMSDIDPYPKPEVILE
jgi:hypothetical protein